MAVFAHPDDEVLCGAGTLALCGQRGRPVTLVCATRGEHGPIADPSLATRETLARVREGELRASCAALGIDDLRWLDLPDGDVSWMAEERGSLATLVAWIRALRPRVLLTFGEDGLYGHIDHTAIGELVIAARRAAAHAAYGGSATQPWSVPRLFFAVTTAAQVRALCDAVAARTGRPARLWGLAPEAFRVLESEISASVDVSSALDRKLAALRSHRTQLEPDNALNLIDAELARRLLSVEHFRCADGLDGDPLTG
jgi:LmbE family N-acetylglucosaminyl deacetylase